MADETDLFPRCSFASIIIAEFRALRALESYVRFALDPSIARRTPGLTFWKAGGTGRGFGFDVVPQLRRLAYFTGWQSPEAFEAFRLDSPIAARLRLARKLRFYTLVPTRAHGRWGGRAVFSPVAEEAAGRPVAVLTRASIFPSSAPAFWSQVGGVSNAFAAAEGRVDSIGFGEIPWVRQATFSVWTSTEAFERFAYATDDHRRVMERARAENWYREELFARFNVHATGTAL